jgi:hypothetical protein
MTPKTSKRLGDAEHILDLPGMGYHQHWIRSLAFSPDGKKLFVSVGSRTNISIEGDSRRAAILISDPDGKNMRIYAGGLRNAVGFAFNVESSALWATVNERDDIGDEVPSDYFTHVVEAGSMAGPMVMTVGIRTIAYRRDRILWPRQLLRMSCWRRMLPRCNSPTMTSRNFPLRTGTVPSSLSTDLGTDASGVAIKSCSCRSAMGRRQERQNLSSPDLSPTLLGRKSMDAWLAWRWLAMAHC